MARRNVSRPSNAIAIIGALLWIVGILGTVLGVAAIGSQVGLWSLIAAGAILLIGIFFTGI